MKEVPNVGKFEVDADGKVTFTPDKQFKGETPELELTRVDANGTPVTVKYQAVVKEVVPTSTNATSTGPQGVPQTGASNFQGGDPLVPIDETVEPTFEDGSKGEDYSRSRNLHDCARWYSNLHTRQAVCRKPRSSHSQTRR